MKKAIAIAVFLILFLNFPFGALASEGSVDNILPQEAEELLLENGFTSLDAESLINLTPNEIFRYIKDCIKKEIDAPFILFYMLFLVIIITSIVSGINGGFLSHELEKSFSAVGILAVCTTAVVPLIACLEESRLFINQMNGFVQVFAPVLSGIMISGGQVNSGAGYQMVILAASEFVAVLLSAVILPLIFVYLAFVIVGRISAGFQPDSITASVKSTVNWTLSLVMTLFVGLITIKGIIGVGADSVALRTGKFFIGSFVPAVGGALSEAAATVQKGVGLIKNTTGIFGIIAACLYFIPPLIKVLIYKFTCNLSAIIGEMLGAEKIAGLVRDISAVLGLISSVILSYGTLVVLSTAVTLIIGGGN